MKIGICLDFMGCGEMTQEDEYAEVEKQFRKILGKKCSFVRDIMDLKAHRSGTEDVVAFIRDLHTRAGEERYSIEEIKKWLLTLPLNSYASVTIVSPSSGIKAVTERSGKEEGK